MIILDLETTGFSHRKDTIIEVAALKVKAGKVIDIFHTLVHPQRPLPQEIKDLTGLSNKDLQGAPLFISVAGNLFKFMGGQKIVGYNVSFDKRFLVANFSRFSSFIYVDFLKYVRSLDLGFPDNKMRTVAAHLGIKIPSRHTARGDVDILHELIIKLGAPS